MVAVRFLLLAALASLASLGCSPAGLKRDLHYVAGATEVAAQGSLLCDWSSTNRSVGNGFAETNPVMGTHPNGSVTQAYFVGVGTGVAVYNRLLPDVLRIVANSVLIGIEIDAVSWNHSVGADPRGCGL